MPQNSPIGVIAAASANPVGFLNDVAAYGEQLYRALAQLRAGDTRAYQRSITPRVARQNLERWRAFQELNKAAALMLPARQARPAQQAAAGTRRSALPAATKRVVLERPGSDRCYFCGIALVMPEDWRLLRTHDPCLLPGAVLIDGVARAANGGPLKLEQRAPVLGYRHQFEHLVPVARRGANEPGNIVSACGWCNSAKGTKTLQELGLSRRSLPSAVR